MKAYCSITKQQNSPSQVPTRGNSRQAHLVTRSTVETGFARFIGVIVETTAPTHKLTVVDGAAFFARDGRGGVGMKGDNAKATENESEEHGKVGSCWVENMRVELFCLLTNVRDGVRVDIVGGGPRRALIFLITCLVLQPRSTHSTILIKSV